MPQSKPLKKTVPRSALMFEAEFTPSSEAAPERAEDGTLKIPFSMTARTGGIAQHPYWGRCVHDFEGMVPAKPTITVDYCHCPEDVIGFSDKQELVDNSLRLAGMLVSLQPMDRAEEVVLKRKAGVPYEASILTNWDGLVIEDISDGMVATVNGQEVAGPVTIFRKWQLWGVAVCPYGSDASTDIQFAAGVPGEVEIAFQKGHRMSGNATPKTGRDYMDRFGKQRGAMWFAEGKDWDESIEQMESELTEEVAAKDQEIADLKEQMAALQAKYDALMEEKEQVADENEEVKAENATFKRGTDPVSGNPPNSKPAQVAKEFRHLSPGMATFAASIKLPGQTSKSTT